MRILGLDPGTLAMGYGAIEGEPPAGVEWGVLSLPSRLPLEKRLLKLYEGLEEIVSRLQPQEVAVEEPFVAQNPRSGLAIGRAQGVAMLVAARHRLPIFRYSPAQVKQQAASYGGSDKLQVQEMVRLQLGLTSAPQPDAADALAVALCHHYQSRLSRQFPSLGKS